MRNTEISEGKKRLKDKKVEKEQDFMREKIEKNKDRFEFNEKSAKFLNLEQEGTYMKEE